MKHAEMILHQKPGDYDGHFISPTTRLDFWIVQWYDLPFSNSFRFGKVQFVTQSWGQHEIVEIAQVQIIRILDQTRILNFIGFSLLA